MLSQRTSLAARDREEATVRVLPTNNIALKIWVAIRQTLISLSIANCTRPIQPQTFTWRTSQRRSLEDSQSITSKSNMIKSKMWWCIRPATQEEEPLITLRITARPRLRMRTQSQVRSFHPRREYSQGRSEIDTVMGQSMRLLRQTSISHPRDKVTVKIDLKHTKWVVQCKRAYTRRDSETTTLEMGVRRPQWLTRVKILW